MTIKILLAEDQAENRMVLIRRLQKQGFEVVPAADGVEAISAFAREKPDIVLMDLAMPNMSGLEALIGIRAASPGSAAPVIALTAHATDDVQAKCLENGFSAFVTKPIDLPALVQLIHVLLKSAA